MRNIKMYNNKIDIIKSLCKLVTLVTLVIPLSRPMAQQNMPSSYTLEENNPDYIRITYPNAGEDDVDCTNKRECFVREVRISQKSTTITVTDQETGERYTRAICISSNLKGILKKERKHNPLALVITI